MGSALLPSFPIISFVPFLAYLYLGTSFLSALWISTLVGIVVDLFSSFPFGLNAIAYTLTTFVLYKHKRFLQEGFISFFCTLFIIGCTFTALELPLFLIFDKENIGVWSLSDLIKIPFYTSLWGIILCYVPIRLANILAYSLKNRRYQ
jgi:rod shape-determining protein MreD